MSKKWNRREIMKGVAAASAAMAAANAYGSDYDVEALYNRSKCSLLL